MIQAACDAAHTDAASRQLHASTRQAHPCASLTELTVQTTPAQTIVTSHIAPSSHARQADTPIRAYPASISRPTDTPRSSPPRTRRAETTLLSYTPQRQDDQSRHPTPESRATTPSRRPRPFASRADHTPTPASPTELSQHTRGPSPATTYSEVTNHVLPPLDRPARPGAS